MKVVELLANAWYDMMVVIFEGDTDKVLFFGQNWQTRSIVFKDLLQREVLSYGTRGEFFTVRVKEVKDE